MQQKLFSHQIPPNSHWFFEELAICEVTDAQQYSVIHGNMNGTAVFLRRCLSVSK